MKCGASVHVTICTFFVSPHTTIRKIQGRVYKTFLLSYYFLLTFIYMTKENKAVNKKNYSDQKSVTLLLATRSLRHLENKVIYNSLKRYYIPKQGNTLTLLLSLVTKAPSVKGKCPMCVMVSVLCVC
jgi:hypothetical protein